MPLLDALAVGSAAADGRPELIRRMLSSVRQHLSAWRWRMSRSSSRTSPCSAASTHPPRGADQAGRPAVARRCLLPPHPGGPPARGDAGTSQFPLAAAMPITQAVPIGAHMSVPVKLRDGSIYGMFCCLSPRTNATLNDRDLQVMRAFADLAAIQIDEDLAGQRQQLSKREQIEALIRERRITILMQPIFDFARREPTGFECLSRFATEPRRSPDQWFNEAGSVGLGAALELAAIEAAWIWKHASRSDLREHQRIREGLMDEGFDAASPPSRASRLVIELTEHAAVQEYETLSRRSRRSGPRESSSRSTTPAPAIRAAAYRPAAAGHHQARHVPDPRHRQRSGAARARLRPRVLCARDRLSDRRGGRRDGARDGDPEDAGHSSRTGLSVGAADAAHRGSGPGQGRQAA